MEAVAAAARRHRAPPPFTHAQIKRVLWGVVVCILLAAVDQTVVVPAVPAIAADLHGFGHLSWIVAAYMITSTSAMPIYGKLSDLHGRRALLLPAIVLFVTASILCAMSQSLLQLIAFRAPAGDRRRRVDVDGAGDDRRHRGAARARPLPGLHGDDVGDGERVRADRGRLDHRSPVLALHFLDQCAGGDRRVPGGGAGLEDAARAASAERDRLCGGGAADRAGDLFPAGDELGRDRI